MKKRLRSGQWNIPSLLTFNLNHQELVEIRIFCFVYLISSHFSLNWKHLNRYFMTGFLTILCFNIWNYRNSKPETNFCSASNCSVWIFFHAPHHENTHYVISLEDFKSNQFEQSILVCNKYLNASKPALLTNSIHSIIDVNACKSWGIF